MTLVHLSIAVLINLIWGSMYIAAKMGLEEFPPIFFTAIRFSLLLFCLSGFLKVPKNLRLPLLKIGFLMGVGVYSSLYISVSLATNTSSLAIFSKLEVPVAIILGVILLNEKVGIKRITGIAIAMLGAALIGFDPAAFDNLPALLWMIISACFGAYLMIKIRELGDVHPLTITAWVSLVGAPFLLLISLIFESDHLVVIENSTTLGWSMLIYTGVMSSVVAHSGLFYLLQRYPVSQIAPFSLLSPLFAVIGGVILLGDELTPALIIGGCLILFGVGWIIKRSR